MIAVLGHYPDYVRVAASNGWPHFQVDMDLWLSWSEDEQWAENRAFLDKVIALRGRFILATPPSKARAGSWFRKELDYIALCGYSARQAEDFWELLP
ncbi:hypothetical protein [Sandarakinorhabdus sp.]|uniref:hypothetical protein n=1 Tax=Sandarakinorhabdus sp. TaxID=1916663 RepID=UPI003F6EEA7F